MEARSENPGAIALVNPPWKLKGTVYSFMMYSRSKEALNIGLDRSFLYPSLEEKSAFANWKFLGGLGMVQIIRYTESPVGSYDEMLIVPGSFEYDMKTVGKEGDVKIERKKNARITRIYVSQKETCYNGRTHWNIPKHLAKFTFATLSNKRISITVQPFDDSSGAVPNDFAPFFSATFKPIPYLPSIPASTNAAKYLGIDLNLVQPPLPSEKTALGELPGTDRWCKIMPFEYSRRTSLGWWDMKQDSTTENDPFLAGEASSEQGKKEGYENWWPGIGKWRIGMVMEAADITFPEGQYWRGPSL